jgi:hypothetical protein
MSNVGQPLAVLPPTQARDLKLSGIGSEVRYLGTRGGTSFYTGQSLSGGPCFLTSRNGAREPEFSVVACLAAGTNPVPSLEVPVVDFSALYKGPADRLPRVQWFAGFASDDVSRIGIVDESGRVYSTPVVANVYGANGPTPLRAQALVAYDRSGSELYRRSLVAPPALR